MSSPRPRSPPLNNVAASPRIARAYAVHCGRYGDVQRLARRRGVCRPWLYREAAWVQDTLAGAAPRRDRLRQRVRQLRARVAHLERRLAQAVVLDRAQQAEFAAVGQAVGVSLPDVRTLLDVLRPGRAPSVATPGRWTPAAGARAGPRLAALDEWTRGRVVQAVPDELYVRQPVMMVVEPESLCWVSGRLTESLSGEAWAQERGRLPPLEQVTRDGGSCLTNGLAELNRRRQEQGQAPVADPLDHSHLLRAGGRGLGRAERAAQRAQVALVQAEAQLAQRRRQGLALTGLSNRVRALRVKADRALAVWVERDAAWQKTKEAVQLFTPEGELNTPARAAAALAEALPRLPDADFATAKRLLQRPQALAYLGEVQRKLAAVPVPAEVREAAVQQEGLRRRPEALGGDSASAAARRGVLLLCAVVLAKAGEVGQQAVQQVRAVLRGCGRASSLVECVNGVVRRQQARHRQVSQSLLDLKRLYGNSQVFRTGRRRGPSPYQRLGVPWPQGVRWWDLLQWSPEQLRSKLSTLKKTG